MRFSGLLIFLSACLALRGGIAVDREVRAGQSPVGGWQVHDPIVHSNLTIFPLTTERTHSTRNYITLDEGLAAGTVKVAELGAGLIRRRPGGQPRPIPEQAQVNQLVLINDSNKALILLAGEVVTGGKQDRVIAKDRIIPPGAEPLPLDVFCVEPGRWHGTSLAFEGKSFMVAPRVREKAASAKNQQEVWDSTAAVREGVAAGVAPAARAELGTSSSYIQLERSDAFKRRIDQASSELAREYERALRGTLRGKDVVGVVIAVNGEVIWADLFAEPELFEKYWPKLLRSYVVEALSVPLVEHAQAARADAESFLAEQEGKQIIEIEPGEYRLLEVQHPRYAIFELASLIEKTEPVLHFSKLRKETAYERIRPLHRPR